MLDNYLIFNVIIGIFAYKTIGLILIVILRGLEKSLKKAIEFMK